MAYVRKTDTLLSDIVSTTYEMERKALDLHNGGALEIGSALYKNIRTCAETAAWKLAPELQYTTPDAWKVSRANVSVHLKAEDGSHLFKQDISSPDHDQFALPFINTGGRYDYDVSVPFNEMSEDVKAYALGAGDRKAKKTEIKESYASTRMQLRLFLEQHASLNAALTTMPELELYVPEKYMAKFREKAAPRVKEKVTYAEDLGIDVDVLAANAIAHRLTA